MLLPAMELPDLPANTTKTKSAYELMEPFLLQINRKVNKVLGDGNCLFRALSEQTTGTSGKHAELRKLLLAK